MNQTVALRPCRFLTRVGPKASPLLRGATEHGTRAGRGEPTCCLLGPSGRGRRLDLSSRETADCSLEPAASAFGQVEQNRVFCYANGQLRKAEQNDEILKFVKFWKARTGKLPEELVFDSKLTTYENLNRINQMDIPFITLRRRSAKLLEEIRRLPASAWRKIQLDNISRIHGTPRIPGERIELQG